MKSNQADNPAAIHSVAVRAPARIHLGFLDLNATIGRRFGSIGLAVSSHYTQLKVRAADHFTIHDSGLAQEIRTRLENISSLFYQGPGRHLAASQRAQVQVDQLIPSHAGLGSGTQLALSLGTALARLHSLDFDTTTLAQELGRGRRSGIGIAGFDQGGFIVDGGLKPGQTVPPLLMHQRYPAEWRIVLIMAPQHQGIHGRNEKQAFRELPPFPLPHAQTICHKTLMQLLPALVERDIDQFGSAITDIQALIGDHFAPAQGGRYTSPVVAACLQQAQRLGHKGIAQSSWGPTGCVFVSSEQEAQKLIGQLTDFIETEKTSPAMPQFISTQPDNRGAIIETTS